MKELVKNQQLVLWPDIWILSKALKTVIIYQNWVFNFLRITVMHILRSAE